MFHGHIEEALIGFIGCNAMTSNPGFSTYKNSSQKSFVSPHHACVLLQTQPKFEIMGNLRNLAQKKLQHASEALTNKLQGSLKEALSHDSQKGLSCPPPPQKNIIINNI